MCEFVYILWQQQQQHSLGEERREVRARFVKDSTYFVCVCVCVPPRHHLVVRYVGLGAGKTYYKVPTRMSAKCVYVQK